MGYVADADADWLRDQPQAVLARVRVPSGRRRRLAHRRGLGPRLRAAPSSARCYVVGGASPGGTARPSSVTPAACWRPSTPRTRTSRSTSAAWDQSNTSILFGDRLVMKTFRRIDNGVNPELELGIVPHPPTVRARYPRWPVTSNTGCRTAAALGPAPRSRAPRLRAERGRRLHVHRAGPGSVLRLGDRLRRRSARRGGPRRHRSRLVVAEAEPPELIHELAASRSTPRSSSASGPPSCTAPSRRTARTPPSRRRRSTGSTSAACTSRCATPPGAAGGAAARRPRRRRSRCGRDRCRPRGRPARTRAACDGRRQRDAHPHPR